MKNAITFCLLVLIPILSFSQENSAGKSYYVDYQSWNDSEEKPNTHINCGNNEILNTGEELTIEAWIRPNRAVEDQKLIGKALLMDGASTPDNGYVFGLNVASIYSEIWNPTRNSVEITGPGTLAVDSAWMHITTTFKAGDKLVNYLNGVLYSEVDVELTNPIGTNDGDLIIGLAPWDALSLMYFGQIDEIKIWNRALTENEIKTNMHIPLNGDEENLVAYYNFDDATDTVVNDLSGNGNTGKVRVSDNEFWSWADSYAPIGSDEMKDMYDVDASWSFKNSDQWQFFESGAAQGSTDIEEKEYEKYFVIGHDMETGASSEFNPEETEDANYIHANREFLFNSGGNVLATNLYFDLNSMGMDAADIPTDSEASLYTLLWRASETDNYTPKYHPTGVNMGFLIFENIPLNDGFYTIGHGVVELNDINENEAFGKNINVYPNPANEIVTITNTQNKNIQICDISGRIINEFQSESISERLDVSEFQNGVYFIRISKDNLLTTKKLVINQ